MLASVIIPVSRPTASLAKCLESLADMTPTPVEVILVGNVQGIPAPPSLNVKMVPEARTSPSVRRNIGVIKSSGDILCFIDDDVQVSSHWLARIIERLEDSPKDIIGGPNLDMRPEFRYRFPSAIQCCILTEGLISHRHMKSNARQVGIHDLPSCNVAMTHETFNDVGGFNEKLSYYLDDVEFNYIALKLGHRLMLCRDLEVQHDIRPAFLSYFRYKWKSRWEIGRIFPVYYRLYIDSFQIKLVILSYLLLALIFILGGFKALSILGAAYFALTLVAAVSHFRDLSVFISLPLGIFLTHLMMYGSFSIGLLSGLVNYHKLRQLIPQRNRRFNRVC